MKNKRQAKILEIIQNNNVNTQKGLLDMLKEAGFDATQATISRDIREMKLVKVSDGGIYKYAAQDSSPQTSTFRDIIFNSVVSVDYALNTVVLRCHTGMAQAACAALDSFGFNDIVGTLAGDDTVFVLARTESAAQSLSKMLREGIFVKKNLSTQ